MLRWIPLLGPIIQGISSIFTGYFSEKSTIYQAGAVRDVEEAKVSAQIIATTQDDIALRIMRDAICLPVTIWALLIGWDTIIVRHWPKWMWHIDPYPNSVGYMPYVVLVFLFGNIGLNMWNRR